MCKELFKGMSKKQQLTFGILFTPWILLALFFGYIMVDANYLHQYQITFTIKELTGFGVSVFALGGTLLAPFLYRLGLEQRKPDVR